MNPGVVWVRLGRQTPLSPRNNLIQSLGARAVCYLIPLFEFEDDESLATDRKKLASLCFG